MTSSPEDRRAPEVEARWRQVLEVAPEAYVAVDARGSIVDWNLRAQALFGWSREEVVGRFAGDLLAGGPTSAAEEALARATRAASPDRSSETFDLMAVARSGRVFAARCTVWGVDRRGGVVAHAFVQDVTDRRRAEESAALLTAVVQGTSDAMITRDLDGVLLSWNAGAERIYGWSAHEAVGRRDALFVPPDRADELREMTERLVRGERVERIETERLTRGGTRVPVALSLSPVHDAVGRVVATSAIARDMTEQRWMATTLDETLLKLQTAADEAREAEAAGRRFLADAAHQLRTPLAGIRACAETLLRGTDAHDAERLLALVVSESARAGDLVGALLRIARIDAGAALTAEPVDLVALCRAEIERLLLASRELAVVLDVRQAPAAPLLLDRSAVREVLSNLGDNALRHACTEVRLVVDLLPDRVLVRVVDDGPGLPAGAREAVFERFTTLDGRGGSGLGLAIGRGLARAMGGDLVHDEQGGRGGFSLTLPRTQGEARPGREPQGHGPSDPGPGT